MTEQSTDEAPIPPWRFCDRLRRSREFAGLSREEMAEKLDVPTARYNGWEGGRFKPRADALMEVVETVSKATGVPVMWLLGQVDPRTPRMYVESNYTKDIQEGYGDSPRYFETEGEPPLLERPFALHNAR